MVVLEETDYSTLSKGQRKKLKKEKRKREKEIERKERKRKQRNKKLILYSINILIILAVFSFFYWRSIPPKDAPVIEVTPSKYNFGAVSQSEGIRTAELKISNKGSAPLILSNMDSSCGCTSVSVVYKGVEGPVFSMSMHGNNPTDWEQIIPPDDSAILKVYYDPNVHKTLRGPVTRSVYLFSNDPRNRKKEVRISLVQID